MSFERIWDKIASLKQLPPVAKVVFQTLFTYTPFDQIASEIATTFARVRDVLSDVEDLNGATERFRSALPPPSQALENSSPPKRHTITVIVKELNEELNEFLQTLRDYHGEEAEALEGVLSERTFFKRKLAVRIHEDVASIKHAIVAKIKEIEQSKALPIETYPLPVAGPQPRRTTNPTSEKSGHSRELQLQVVRKFPNSTSARGRRLSQESKHCRAKSVDSSPSNSQSPPSSPSLDALGQQIKVLDEHAKELERCRVNLQPKTHSCQVLAGIVYPFLCITLTITLWLSACRHGSSSGFLFFIAYVVVSMSVLVSSLSYRHSRNCRCWPMKHAKLPEAG